MPDLYIIAGCNGAGKTTAAYHLLPDIFTAVEFVNADEIARGLSPFNPSGAALQAGRIMLERMEQLMERQQSFSFETTLSGLTYLSLIKRAKEKGYTVIFFFVYLESIQLAIERVAIRVSKGGHTIPLEVIKRRYQKGLDNFSRYANEAHDWYLYNNSGNEYKLIANNVNNIQEIISFDLFQKIMGHG